MIIILVTSASQWLIIDVHTAHATRTVRTVRDTRRRALARVVAALARLRTVAISAVHERVRGTRHRGRRAGAIRQLAIRRLRLHRRAVSVRGVPVVALRGRGGVRVLRDELAFALLALPPTCRRQGLYTDVLP